MMLRYVLAMLIISIAMTLTTVAQDDDAPPFDPEKIPNFERILLNFEIPMEDNDFLLANQLAIQPDLSRIYVGSGAIGVVLVFDDKGALIDQVDVFYEGPVTDMAVGADGNLYVVQFGNLYAYDPDGRQIGQLAGDFLEDIKFTRLTSAPDKTLYLLDSLSEKDRLYHLTDTGEDILVTDFGYLGEITGDDPSIFDQLKVGQDGLLYYFSEDALQMVVMDEAFEVVTTYSNLLTDPTGAQRTGMLIDKQGRVLFGNNGAVEIYGDKEELVYTIKLPSEFEFVYDLAFADNGQLVILQGSQVTIMQYGVRDEE